MDEALAERIRNTLPVVSTDAKKEENLGNFKDGVRERPRKGEAVQGLDHDFPIEALGKATLYGIHDLQERRVRQCRHPS